MVESKEACFGHSPMKDSYGLYWRPGQPSGILSYELIVCWQLSIPIRAKVAALKLSIAVNTAASMALVDFHKPGRIERRNQPTATKSAP